MYNQSTLETEQLKQFKLIKTMIFIFIFFFSIHAHCLSEIFSFPVLAEDAIKAALSDYRLKQQDKEEERVKASS